MLKVSGEEDKRIYSGKIQEGVYLPEGGAVQTMPETTADTQAMSKKAKTLAEQLEHGKQKYMETCFACHQAEGQGIAGAFPPLAKSDYLNADVKRAISSVIKGLSGEITVNGEVYNSIMPAQTLSDEEVADILTYVYHSWGNNKTVVSEAQVKAARK